MIATANEGWRAIYMVKVDGVEQAGLAVTRDVAAWVGEQAHGGEQIVGMVVNERGELWAAHKVDNFVCYCSPDDDPVKVLQERAAVLK